MKPSLSVGFKLVLGLCTAMAACGASAQTADGCRYVPGSTLKLELAGASLAPLVEGHINQKPFKMLVDTGAQKTSLLRGAVDELGLSMERVPGLVAGAGGGTASQFLVRVKDVGFGEIEARNLRLRVLDHGSFGNGALVGADFLFQADLEIALAEGKLRFFHPDGCADTFLAYWDRDASEIATERESNDDMRSQFEVKVNGQTMRAMIDTGAGRSYLDMAAAARAGITPQSAGVTAAGKVGGVGGKRVDVWLAPVASFGIGDESINNTEILFADLRGDLYGSRMPDMILGRDFLRAHRVLFAGKQQRLYFSYLGGPVFARQTDGGAR